MMQNKSKILIYTNIQVVFYLFLSLFISRDLFCVTYTYPGNTYGSRGALVRQLEYLLFLLLRPQGGA